MDKDIMYQDNLVCILRPNIKKGIIIWSNYTQPSNMESLSILGLKTGKKLKEEGIDFGRSKIHPYIFFRAPYFSANIDYSTIETEIISSYGHSRSEAARQPARRCSRISCAGQDFFEFEQDNITKIFIRVDPDKTFVFSSEIRVDFFNEADTKIFDSKKKLSEYLKIIKTNLEIENNFLKKQNEQKQKILYNLFSSKAKLFPNTTNPGKIFSNIPINRNSEILISIPHLTSDYFVLCLAKNI
jgi:hypothetical protein